MSNRNEAREVQLIQANDGSFFITYRTQSATELFTARNFDDLVKNLDRILNTVEPILMPQVAVVQ